MTTNDASSTRLAAFDEVSSILTRIKDLCRVEVQDEVAQAQRAIQSSIDNIHSIAGAKEHFNREVWRKRMPGLSEQALDLMMDWRRDHMDIPLESLRFPKAEIEDELVGGVPTGKVNIVRILEV